MLQSMEGADRNSHGRRNELVSARPDELSCTPIMVRSTFLGSTERKKPQFEPSGILPANIEWQCLANLPLDTTILHTKVVSMTCWQEFVTTVAPYGSPVYAARKPLPGYAQDAVRRRGRMTDAEAASFRAEQRKRLLSVAQAHKHEKPPRYALLQKLAKASGCKDTCLREDGRDGMMMHGTLMPSNQWLQVDKKTPLTAEQSKLAVDALLKEQSSNPQKGFTRGRVGKWQLPGQHERVLLQSVARRCIERLVGRVLSSGSATSFRRIPVLVVFWRTATERQWTMVNTRMLSTRWH